MQHEDVGWTDGGARLATWSGDYVDELGVVGDIDGNSRNGDKAGESESRDRLTEMGKFSPRRNSKDGAELEKNRDAVGIVTRLEQQRTIPVLEEAEFDGDDNGEVGGGNETAGTEVEDDLTEETDESIGLESR